MRIFFLTLLLSLAVAGLACAQDTLSREPLLLAAGPDGNSPGGPGGGNATRSPDQGQPPAWDGRKGESGGAGQGRPDGPPPGFSGSQGSQGGQGRGPGKDRAVSQACSGKAAGDECCSDDPRGGRICGECVKARQGDGLECRPRRQ